MTPFFKGGHMKNLQIEFTYTLNLEVEDYHVDSYLTALSNGAHERLKTYLDKGVYTGLYGLTPRSKVTNLKCKVEDL